jgi:hypothetical protein
MFSLGTKLADVQLADIACVADRRFVLSKLWFSRINPKGLTQHNACRSFVRRGACPGAVSPHSAPALPRSPLLLIG